MSEDAGQPKQDDPGAFRTLAGTGTSETKVEGSRFLGMARPVASEAAAQEQVAQVRSEHHDARHVCYGLRVGLGAARIDRSNDDGEPARTGGFPIWQLLSTEEIENALVIVVRYFGGTKLGMGGLKRAYRDAAKAAVESAGTTLHHPVTTLDLSVSYEHYDALERLIEGLEVAQITDRQFAADIDVELTIWSSKLTDIKRRLGDLLGRHPADLGSGEGP